MENIINQLMELESDSFLVYCIKKSILAKMEAGYILRQIKSQANDNPTLMERTIGAELFNQIKNVAV